MDNKRFSAALAVAAICVAITGCDSSSSTAHAAYASAGVPARYATQAHEENDDDSSDEARQAKAGFEDAAADLRSSVRALSYTPWRDQMDTIRSKLSDAEEALERLEALRPSDPAVQSARDEVDTMRSHMDRLSYENWRGVRPDLDTTSSSIEDEASSISTTDDE